MCRYKIGQMEGNGLNSRNEGLEKQIKSRLQGWNADADTLMNAAQLLNAAAQLYQATEDAFYKDYVIEQLSKLVSEDGSIAGVQENCLTDFLIGNVAYFGLAQTKEEKYEKAIKKLAKRLDTQPRDEKGVFLCQAEEAALADSYFSQTFYVNYETLNGGKERYNDIIAQYSSIHKNQYAKAAGKLGGDAKAQEEAAYYCAALIDSMQMTAQPVYENFRKMQDLYKEVVKALLAVDETDKKPAAEAECCTAGDLMQAYAILKGCRMKALHTEKYEAGALSILDRAVTAVEKSSNALASKDVPFVSAFVLAYSERLKNRQYQDYGRGKGGVLWS